MTTTSSNSSSAHAGTTRNDRAASLSGPPLVAALWRNRALLAILLAFGFALWGEFLLRHSIDTKPADPALGGLLLWLAALVVGLAAWVGIGRGASVAGSSAGIATPNERFAAWRARFGPRWTAAGLILALLLCGVLLALLRTDFRAPLASLLWIASLLALALAFAGLKPSGARLLARDPGEPADPPVTRNEWLLIGGIVLVAAVLRLWDLENIPLGPHIDEAARALDARHINQGLPVDNKEFAFFGTGWWGVPSAYFWLVAQSMSLFGNTLGGARVVHALAGIATVFVVYRLGRVAWSPRVGLLAAALLAVSDFAIHFSRTAGESTITILTWALCFYYLYKALISCRALDFVWSGIAGGLSLYGYVAGKLLPVVLALVSIYLLLRWGRVGLRRYLPGLALLALTAALVYAPNGFYALNNPGDFTMRYDDVAIFTHADEYRKTYGTDNWGAILAGQFTLTYSTFDSGEEIGPFYPTRQPVLPVPWATLWMVGVAYILWRSGDARFLMLSLWIVGGLAGPALTTHTPTIQRAAVLVPLLALVPALLIDRAIRGAALPAALAALPQLTRRMAVALPLALLVLVLAFYTLPYYFGVYVPVGRTYRDNWVGHYAASLDPRSDVVYQMGLPDYFWDATATEFLAPDIAGRDFANPATNLPLITDTAKTAHFLVFPSNEVFLPLLQTYYPEGAAKTIVRPVDKPFFSDYIVNTPQLAALQLVTATYTATNGSQLQRQEPYLGISLLDNAANEAPLAEMTYPHDAEWSVGLVAPQYGDYQFELRAPGGAQLEIDGSALLVVEPGTSGPVSQELTLAAGLHQVSLRGTLPDANAPLSLRWAIPGAKLAPVAPNYLFNGPAGAFLGRWYLPAGDPTWFTTPRPPSDNLALTSAQIAPVLGWHDLDLLPFGVWSARLLAPESGEYHFDMSGDPMVSLWLDGQMVGARGVEGVPDTLNDAVTLAAGEHALELRLQARYADTRFEFYWQPPGRDPALILPTDLAAPVGGAWKK